MRTWLDCLLVLVLVALFGSLEGCAGIEAIQKQRRELFAPEPLPSYKTVFSKAYGDALKEAHANPTPVTITSFVDAGNALNARSCNEWLSRVTLARRGLVASDHALGVAGALATTLAGIARASSTTVAVLGATEVALQGLSTGIQNDVLGAPSEYQAQQTILSLLGSCSDRLLADAPALKFSQAYSRLEGCARYCSHDAASAAATRALQVAPPQLMGQP